MYCRKEMVELLKCYLIPKKSYGTLSKGAIFFGQPCILTKQTDSRHLDRIENIFVSKVDMFKQNCC